MSVNVGFLSAQREGEYEKFINSMPSTMLYASIPFRNLLCSFLDATDKYLVAIDSNDCIVGALPTFIKHNREYGSILNSLPFYGSHGAVITTKEDPMVGKALIRAFDELAKANDCTSATIITSPFTQDFSIYEEELKYDFLDSRIGQITSLPIHNKETDPNLMEIYHYKTRNMIRKAQRLGVTIEKKTDSEAMEFIFSIHKENMREIGGLAKPKCLFDSIWKEFSERNDFAIYIAYLKQRPIAGLLLFFYNHIVEYFTPVIVKDYRAYQPLSLLIFKAMTDAVNANCKYWNWGGTWLNQDGVYNFKKRWGTRDYPYYYFTRLYDKSILNLSKSKILELYPYFYVVPFSKIS